jgi:hypothetical protein
MQHAWCTQPSRTLGSARSNYRYVSRYTSRPRLQSDFSNVPDQVPGFVNSEKSKTSRTEIRSIDAAVALASPTVQIRVEVRKLLLRLVASRWVAKKEYFPTSTCISLSISHACAGTDGLWSNNEGWEYSNEIVDGSTVHAATGHCSMHECTLKK